MVVSNPSESPEKGRKDAIDKLIRSYQEKYNGGGNQGTNGFFVDSSVSFVVSGGGISVQAVKDIPQGAVLVKLPREERTSLSNVSKEVIHKIKANYQSVQHKEQPEFGHLSDIYSHGDICLAVLIMQDLAQKKLYTEAWLSPKDFREQYYPLWWEAKEDIRHLLKGTYTLDTLERYAKSLRFAFDECVKPVLLKAKIEDYVPKEFQEECTSQEDSLWETFRYAQFLLPSRSHDGRAPDEPKILPIVDTFNGVPSYCKDQINVDLTTNVGVGGVLSDTVKTSKDIQAGQELIIDYGDIRASGCIIRYACCPKEVVNNAQASLDVTVLQVPPFLAPSDPQRTRACRQSGYPTTKKQIEQDFAVVLGYDVLASYAQSPVHHGESDQLKSMRQFLMICHLLDDEAVKINVETGQESSGWRRH